MEQEEISTRQRSIIAGRYSIVSKLGSGRFGEVFMVKDEMNGGTLLAMKILHPVLCTSADFLQRISRDVNVMQAVDHPNVLRIFDMGQDGGHYFYTMELLRGKTLSKLVLETDQDGLIAWPRLRLIFQQMCLGIKAIHSTNVAHQDLRSGTIWIDDKDRIKFVGFGFNPATAAIATQSQGTPTLQGYPAPEMQSGSPETAQSNLYSLGMVFSELAVGVAKNRKRAPTTTKQKGTTFAGFRKDVPAWAEVVLKKLTARALHERAMKVDSVLQLIPSVDQKTNTELEAEKKEADSRESSGLRPFMKRMSMIFDAKEKSGAITFDDPNMRRKSMQILLSALVKPKESPTTSSQSNLKMVVVNDDKRSAIIFAKMMGIALVVLLVLMGIVRLIFR